MIENKSVGRPLIYQEETKVVSFRIPKSAIKEVKYTEEAQDLFNEFYDEFLTMIEECKA